MRFKRILPVVSLVSAAAFLFTVLIPVRAAVQPYVEGGDIYRVRNLSKGTNFTDPAMADKCDYLQYRVRIHNPGPDAALENVVVKAVIPAEASTRNVSTVTITASNANPGSRSDTATVNLPSAQKISYIPGSSQLLDANGGVISRVGDVVSGVNIGKVGVSVNQKRFVQFKAKVDCSKPQPPKPQPPKPQPPKPPKPPHHQPPKPPRPPQPPEHRQQERPETPVVVTPTTPSPPSSSGGVSTAGATEVLPQTGPSQMATIFFGVTALSSGAYYLVARRLGQI